MAAARPKPDDFDALRARLVHIKTIARHYGTYTGAVRRWIENKAPKNALRAVPADFVEMAATRSGDQLRRLYRCHSSTVKRWVAETGAKTQPKSGPAWRPVPSDFAELAPTMTKTALRDHYRTSDKSITRWLLESGTCAKVFISTGNPNYGKPRPTIAAGRISTMWDDEADVILQRAIKGLRQAEEVLDSLVMALEED